MRKSFKHSHVAVLGLPVKVAHLDDAHGSVELIDDPVTGHRHLEFALDFKVTMRVEYEKRHYDAHLFFHGSAHMHEWEPEIELLWPDHHKSPRGMAFSQVEGALRSSKVKRFFRHLLHDFKHDFIHFENVNLVDGVQKVDTDSDSEDGSIGEDDYSDTDSNVSKTKKSAEVENASSKRPKSRAEKTMVVITEQTLEGNKALESAKHH